MEFSWNNNLINIKNNYRQIIENFCRSFHHTYDNQLNDLYKYFCDSAYITFADREFTGCRHWLSHLYGQNIFSVTHNSIKVNGQPLNDNGVLITIHGLISFNNSFDEKKYVETIVLKRVNDDRFLISNMIIKILE